MSVQHWLDDLAKTLARSTTRREALRGIGAAFAAVMIPGAAVAGPDCAKACKALGLTGKALGDCISSCAVTGQMSYVQCGSAVCGPGTYCCNESCSICVPIGSTCIQIYCAP